jgi:hypothetical protein
MRYPKDGTFKFRVLQEPKDWVYFWEHYPPVGFPFPCTNDRKTCPGCISDNEKMKKPSRKVAFNALEGEYVNVWKIPPLLADKLKLRFDRFGTVTDRDYSFTRYKTSGDKTEYDVEGEAPREIDLSKFELKEIEPMLVESYNEVWGDSQKVRATEQRIDDAAADAALKERMDKAVETQEEKPPF